MIICLSDVICFACLSLPYSSLIHNKKNNIEARKNFAFLILSFRSRYSPLKLRKCEQKKEWACVILKRNSNKECMLKILKFSFNTVSLMFRNPSKLIFYNLKSFFKCFWKKKAQKFFKKLHYIKMWAIECITFSTKVLKRYEKHTIAYSLAVK